jgi:fructose-bisphosphate aldolase class II
MRLVSIVEMLKEARIKGYAVGAFNILNLEMLQAIVTAAESRQAPVILQVWHGDLDLIGGVYAGAAAKAAASVSSVPIALQLDHGQNIEQVRSCIGWGFSSVMIDLSSESFRDNLEHTKEVVREAHAANVSVEAELGKIYSGDNPVETQKSTLTEPERAAEFVEETDIDALAVSIGTAHGQYVYGPMIDYDLLERLIGAVQVPIVIHGGSFIKDEAIIRLIRLGVSKINVGTELFMTYVDGVRAAFEKNDVTAREIVRKARLSVEEVLLKKLELFTSP